MSGRDIEFDLTGMRKMIKTLEGMNVNVQPAVDYSARKAFEPVRAAIEREAPVGKTNGGTLRSAIIRKRERTRVAGKRVYDATFDKKANSMLQKPIKRPGLYGGKSSKAYYPASQEYGYLARKPGGKIELRAFSFRVDHKQKKELLFGFQSQKIEGKHYMRVGAKESEAQAKQIMIKTFERRLDKLWKKAQHE